MSDPLKAKMQARAARIADRTFEQLRRQAAQLDAAEANTAVWLPVSAIRLDGGTQPRARLNEKVIAEYAGDMRGGAEFPPVDVFYDGEVYWLADGYHRVSAAIEAGLPEVAGDGRAVAHQGDVAGDDGQAVGSGRSVVDGGEGIGAAGRQADRVGIGVGVGRVDGADETGHVPCGDGGGAGRRRRDSLHRVAETIDQ